MYPSASLHGHEIGLPAPVSIFYKVGYERSVQLLLMLAFISTILPEGWKIQLRSMLIAVRESVISSSFILVKSVPTLLFCYNDSIIVRCYEFSYVLDVE